MCFIYVSSLESVHAYEAIIPPPHQWPITYRGCSCNKMCSKKTQLSRTLVPSHGVTSPMVEVLLNGLSYPLLVVLFKDLTFFSILP